MMPLRLRRMTYFCRHCWTAERRAGASRRIAWEVARGKRS
jgi:hypothetical protein